MLLLQVVLSFLLQISQNPMLQYVSYNLEYDLLP
jgi:hypothetical protein